MTKEKNEKLHKSKKEGIVINRMYVGNYLESNLGHEIINLLKADNDHYYLYLNQSGSFAKEHQDKIGYMLLVKNGPKNCFEIIGLAKGLKEADGILEPRKKNIKELQEKINKKQKEYIKKQPAGDIKYDGVSILDIFNDAEQQNIFVTFEAEEVFVPKEGMRLFLRYDNDMETPYKQEIGKDKKIKYFVLKKHKQPRTPLKSYIYKEDVTEDGESALEDYENIKNNIIDNPDLWEKLENKANATKYANHSKVSLFDICGIQNDENRFSFALQYFMNQPEYKNLWIKFFNNYGISLSESYNVEREKSAVISEEKNKNNHHNGGRIDLFISDNDNIIIIENKIKSGLNLIEKDKNGVNQLDRYKGYTDWLLEEDENKNKSPHFFILEPNYNMVEVSKNMSKFYQPITYGELYDYLQSEGVKEIVDKDSNFTDFKNAMFRHTLSTQNEYLFYEMMEKFGKRLKEGSEK